MLSWAPGTKSTVGDAGYIELQCCNYKHKFAEIKYFFEINVKFLFENWVYFTSKSILMNYAKKCRPQWPQTNASWALASIHTLIIILIFKYSSRGYFHWNLWKSMKHPHGWSITTVVHFIFHILSKSLSLKQQLKRVPVIISREVNGKFFVC